MLLTCMACLTLALPALAWAGTADQLRDEARALVGRTVERPYGSAWSATGGNDAATVDFLPETTPAAALALHLAARELTDADLAVARDRALRGMMSSIEPTGRLPLMAEFGRRVGRKPISEAAPDRRATIAASAVLLTILADGPTDRDERVAGSASRMIGWLVQQQTASGAWASAWPTDALPERATRLIRLDDPQFRDATMVLLVASKILRPQPFATAGDKAIDRLLLLRTGADAKVAEGLWYGVYGMNGEPPTDAGGTGPADHPVAVDSLACKYALETLVGAYALTGDMTLKDPIALASKRLAGLGDGEEWERFHLPKTGQPVATTEPMRDDLFTVVDVRRNPFMKQGFGLPAALSAARSASALAPEDFAKLLGAAGSLSDRVALGACGLIDEPMATDLPVTPAEARAYLAARSAPSGASEGLDVPERSRRIVALVQRLRIEKLAGETP